MKLKDLNEKYGEYEVKEGFMDLLIKPRSKTVWDLKYEDRYFYLYSDGSTDLGFWRNSSCEYNARNLGNIFLTREDAKLEIERRAIRNEFLRAGGRLEFRKKEDNYCIFEEDDGRIYINNFRWSNYGLIYFDTEEQAIEAIKTIGEDRLKKYWFVTMEE